MAESKPRVSRGRLALLLWLLACAFYFYIAYDYVSTAMRDREFGDFLLLAVQLSGADNRPVADVRKILMNKALELSLPIADADLKIEGRGRTLRVRVAYSVDINVPVITESVLYRANFSHEVAFQQLTGGS